VIPRPRTEQSHLFRAEDVSANIDDHDECADELVEIKALKRKDRAPSVGASSVPVLAAG
jgi:hypothetical protein